MLTAFSVAACASSGGTATSGTRSPAGYADTVTAATRSARSSADPPATTYPEHGSLSTRDDETAKAIALREARQSAKSVTSATATRSAGRVVDSNTGHACTSGSVLHIRLIGSFTIGIATAGVARPTAPSNDDVHAVLITADPDSGRVCLISVRTGAVRPDPGATRLLTDWTP